MQDQVEDLSWTDRDRDLCPCPPLYLLLLPAFPTCPLPFPLLLPFTGTDRRQDRDSDRVDSGAWDLDRRTDGQLPSPYHLPPLLLPPSLSRADLGRADRQTWTLFPLLFAHLPVVEGGRAGDDGHPSPSTISLSLFSP